MQAGRLRCAVGNEPRRTPSAGSWAFKEQQQPDSGGGRWAERVLEEEDEGVVVVDVEVVAARGTWERGRGSTAANAQKEGHWGRMVGTGRDGMGWDELGDKASDD